MAKAERHNVLILGSGGREHALGWKLKRSPLCGKLFFAPGNAGTDGLGQNVKLAFEPVSTKHADAIDYFCRHNRVDLIVVGPEDPLAGGLVDRLTKMGHKVFGPTQEAARLEGDKAWAKELMRAASIPTADARTFTSFDAAAAYVDARETPVVVKAAGLAKGKGVVVPDSREQAIDALQSMMVAKAFGAAGEKVVIEERLIGQEVSLMALVDGKTLYLLDPAQDHKPVGEGDTGPNTGGMGVVSPTPAIDARTLDEVNRQVLVPTIDALRRDDLAFCGVLYAGLMLTAGGPKVLEFNVRFGDPETQALMPRLRGDLLQAMLLATERKLDQADLSFDPRPCVSVVLASGGYPGDYRKGVPIEGLDEIAAEDDPDLTVFHAGTATDKQGRLVTSGGRVLSVSAVADSIPEARDKANAAAERIRFEGAHFRRDIGARPGLPG
ncbi:MAG: phosphoribosylamine--glycine ligase [Planctomycetota bacterium]